MMTFNDFIKKFNLRNKATSNKKIQQFLSSLPLNDVGVYLRDGLFDGLKKSPFEMDFLMLVLSICTHQKGRIGFLI